MIYLSPLLLLLAGVSLDLLLILLNNTRDFARPTAAPMTKLSSVLFVESRYTALAIHIINT